MEPVRRAALLTLLTLAATAATAAAALQPPPAPGKLGPEGVPVPKAPVLADVANVRPGQTVDGVTCQNTEKIAFHLHAHLTLFVSGHAFQVPYGIGIGQPLKGYNTNLGPVVLGGSCFMWLHTHAADGIVHVEAPKRQTFTLGQFFSVWGVALSRSRIGSRFGKVVSFYKGKPWKGDPKAIPLTNEAQIQLDLGTPLIAPVHIRFPKGLAETTAKTKK
jgi:hypothetical protein